MLGAEFIKAQLARRNQGKAPSADPASLPASGTCSAAESAQSSGRAELSSDAPAAGISEHCTTEPGHGSPQAAQTAEAPSFEPSADSTCELSGQPSADSAGDHSNEPSGVGSVGTSEGADATRGRPQRKVRIAPEGSVFEKLKECKPRQSISHIAHSCIVRSPRRPFRVPIVHPIDCHPIDLRHLAVPTRGHCDLMMCASPNPPRRAAEASGEPYISLEFFPPKTPAGVEVLSRRIGQIASDESAACCRTCTRDQAPPLDLGTAERHLRTRQPAKRKCSSLHRRSSTSTWQQNFLGCPTRLPPHPCEVRGGGVAPMHMRRRRTSPSYLALSLEGSQWSVGAGWVRRARAQAALGRRIAAQAGGPFDHWVLRSLGCNVNRALSNE